MVPENVTAEHPSRLSVGRILGAGAILLLSATIAVSVLFLEWHLLTIALAALGLLVLAFSSPLTSLLLWLFLAPVLDLHLSIPLGAGIPDITFTRTTLTTVFLALMLRSTLGLERPQPIGRIEKLMLAFCAFAALRSLPGGTLPQNLQLLLDGYAFPFLAFFLAKRLISGRKKIGAFLCATGLLAFSLAVVGCAEYFTGVNVIVPEGFIATMKYRAHGPFANSVEFGGVMVLGLLACCRLLETAEGRLWRASIFGGQCCIAVAAFLSLTRSVWLSMVVAVALMAYHSRRLRTYLVTCGVALAVIAAAILPFANLTSLEARVTERGAVEARIVLYVTALKTAVRRPLLGHGFGARSFFHASRRHLSSIGSITERKGAVMFVPHNEFLHVLVMTGLVGLLLHLGILLCAVRNGTSLLRRSDGGDPVRRDTVVICLAAVATFVVNGLFVDLMYFGFFNSLVFMFAGVLARIRIDDKDFTRSASGDPSTETSPKHLQ